jgi:hypothetical protein
MNGNNIPRKRTYSQRWQDNKWQDSNEEALKDVDLEDEEGSLDEDDLVDAIEDAVVLLDTSIKETRELLSTSIKKLTELVQSVWSITQTQSLAAPQPSNLLQVSQKETTSTTDSDERSF